MQPLTESITAAPATRAVSPTSEEVRDYIAGVAGREPTLAAWTTIGYSGQGRPIDAATLTDPTVDDASKQNVLIVAGQHGNEESGRLVAMRLMDSLVAPPSRETLRRQKIVIIPNVNPDGAEDDSYETPAGVKPNMDHGLDGPTIPEARAVEQVAFGLAPDVFIDMHARGHAGCSYDMVLYPQTHAYTEDDNFFHQIASEMMAAGERAGIPHITHPLAWWTEPPQDAGSTTAFAYRNFKSIVMLTESTEHNELHYPRELTAKVGVARVQALLEWGNRRHPKLYYRGYPNALVLGMFSAGIVAAGATAADRRQSRLNIWRRRGHFRSIRPKFPEHCRQKTLLVDYDGPELDCGVGVLLRAAGALEVAEVRLNGRELGPSEVDGYYTYRDHVSTFVVAAAPSLRPGQSVLDVRFA